jgi:hypothetical protein
MAPLIIGKTSHSVSFKHEKAGDLAILQVSGLFDRKR